MDDNTFRLLSSFIVRTRKIVGPVDASRLVNDVNYASEIFRKVEELGGEEEIMLSLTLRQKLGFLENKKTPDPPPPEPPTNNNSKYKFGARG